MIVWFTADLHLGHANIIKYCKRPCEDVDEMDALILDGINKLVRKDDRLYVLGDFSLQGLDVIRDYRKRVVCKDVVCLRGNHDHRKAHTVLGDMPDLKTIKVEGQKIVLCHYAMKKWLASHHGVWHLFGHSHGTLPDPEPWSMDVGWDVWYAPISFKEVAWRMEEIRDG